MDTKTVRFWILMMLLLGTLAETTAQERRITAREVPHGPALTPVSPWLWPVLRSCMLKLARRFVKQELRGETVMPDKKKDQGGGG